MRDIASVHQRRPPGHQISYVSSHHPRRASQPSPQSADSVARERGVAGPHLERPPRLPCLNDQAPLPRRQHQTGLDTFVRRGEER